MHLPQPLLDGRRARGFILTAELMLILSIVGIGAFIGINQIIAALKTKFVTIVDSTGATVGCAVGYNVFEQPIVIFRDPDNGAAVALGVSPFSFTSYSDIFYDTAGCAGTPFIKGVSLTGGQTSGLEQLQNRSYGVGLGNVLYRDDLGGASARVTRSFWGRTAAFPGGSCTTTGATVTPNLALAEMVSDLEAGAPPPYSVVPTP